MAKHISNMDELAKALQPVMIGMVDELAERVYETLNYFLQEYYNSYDPKSYRRQYDWHQYILIRIPWTITIMRLVIRLRNGLIRDCMVD